jgi:hypothetical protein
MGQLSNGRDGLGSQKSKEVKRSQKKTMMLAA